MNALQGSPNASRGLRSVITSNCDCALFKARGKEIPYTGATPAGATQKDLSDECADEYE